MKRASDEEPHVVLSAVAPPGCHRPPGGVLA